MAAYAPTHSVGAKNVGTKACFGSRFRAGNTSHHQLQEKTTRRVNQALVYPRRFQLHLVFVILGPPWVRREVVRIFHDLPEDLAVVWRTGTFWPVAAGEVGTGGVDPIRWTVVSLAKRR